MPSHQRLDAALSHHRKSADAFLETVEGLPIAAWDRPWTEGKWTVGTIVHHLNQTYDVCIREVEGGEGMKIRTPWWQQKLLRWTLLPRIASGKGFPKAAPAPKETRPVEEAPEREATLQGFRERADQLERSARERGAEDPDLTITHAYFGSAPLAEGLTLVTRHIEHHHAQLETVGSAEATTG